MVGMPWERPGDKFGTSQGHPGRLGRFVWKFTFKGQNVRGTDRTDVGTDGTCPGDRWDRNQGVSRQNSLCLLVFSFPIDEQPPSFGVKNPPCTPTPIFATLWAWYRSQKIHESRKYEKITIRKSLTPVWAANVQKNYRKK